MKFAEIGKKMDKLIENTLETRIKNINTEEYVEKKIKPSIKKAINKGAEELGTLAKKVEEKTAEQSENAVQKEEEKVTESEVTE